MKSRYDGEKNVVAEQKNDTVFNVAQLLLEPVGAHRNYRVRIDWFALDRDLVAKDIRASIRLIRIAAGVLLTGSATGIALIECVRCLEIYEQPFESNLEQEYHSMIDVRNGVYIGFDRNDEADDLIEISEHHELDIAEPLRQAAILALPMQPICREECPGLLPNDEQELTGDRRLAVLATLLNDESLE